jgi:hypothetical protein
MIKFNREDIEKVSNATADKLRAVVETSSVSEKGKSFAPMVASFATAGMMKALMLSGGAATPEETLKVTGLVLKSLGESFLEMVESNETHRIH